MSTRPTPRGWAMAVGGPFLWVLGRMLGTVELAMLAAAALVLTIGAAVLVWLAHPVVDAGRRIHPPRLSVGTPGRMEIEVTNRRPWRTPALIVDDAFGERQARVMMPPVGAGGTVRAAYHLPTDRRGIYTVGPLRVAVTDPLGLITRTFLVVPTTEATVYPRVHDVAGLPPAFGPDLVGGGGGRAARARASTDFHALREYAVGDDLRRVHWRSTARLGRLMIREDDVPWQMRATLLLDAFSGRHNEETFERAVETVASVLGVLHRQGALVRFLDTTGREIGFGSGHEHREAVMEALATVATKGEDHLERIVARLRRESGTGAVAAFLGEVGDETLMHLAALRRRFAAVTVVRHRRRPPKPGSLLPGGGGFAVVDAPPGTDVAACWASVISGVVTGNRPKVGSWAPR